MWRGLETGYHSGTGQGRGDDQDQAKATEDIPVAAHPDCSTASHWGVAVPRDGLQKLAEGQKGGRHWGETSVHLKGGEPDYLGGHEPHFGGALGQRAP